MSEAERLCGPLGQLELNSGCLRLRRTDKITLPLLYNHGSVTDMCGGAMEGAGTTYYDRLDVGTIVGEGLGELYRLNNNLRLDKLAELAFDKDCCPEGEAGSKTVIYIKVVAYRPGLVLVSNDNLDQPKVEDAFVSPGRGLIKPLKVSKPIIYIKVVAYRPGLVFVSNDNLDQPKVEDAFVSPSRGLIKPLKVSKPIIYIKVVAYRPGLVFVSNDNLDQPKVEDAFVSPSWGLIKPLKVSKAISYIKMVAYRPGLYLSVMIIWISPRLRTPLSLQAGD
ncbi:hypothetical protein J6590_052004 [Homalodisca vitripennis]|nr:hypothetical protein J6590_052004 [Homalodisca vitripennis]